MLLDFYVYSGARFSLRDKRLFEDKRVRDNESQLYNHTHCDETKINGDEKAEYTSKKTTNRTTMGQTKDVDNQALEI